MDSKYWDDKYLSREQLFSGNPNGVLVTEASNLPPGQALDVGCGEGADSIWLARRGWEVTALDISQIALGRAATSSPDDIADSVTWRQGDMTTTPPPSGAFDLVSLQYVPLLREPEHTALRGLLDAVSPGGTLLFVGHDLTDMPVHSEREFDFSDYYQPGEIAGLLGHEWTIQVNETRPRTAPAGTHHTQDTVLRAQRQG
jgi:2-polyprenyl-3-methyl-5-hydroxy-6-metoxy-1,4-benzoquinol methylase